MKRRIFAVLAVLVVILAACASRRSGAGGQQLQLYFTSTQNHGPSIVGEPYARKEPPAAEDLIGALLSGPTGKDLRSPFPSGLALRSCQLEDGLLRVDFSEQYASLDSLSLTLADYCLVLTVCQLEEVEQVEITCSGQDLPQRSHQTLSQQDVILALGSP